MNDDSQLLRTRVLLASFAVGGVLGWALVSTPEANAEAETGVLALSPQRVPAPPAPACTYRSASHQAEHGGQAADDAYHLAHGDLPTCDGEDAGPTPVPVHTEDEQKDNDNRLFHREHRWWRND